MELEPIAALLEQTGCGVKAQSIFINEMRAGDAGILLKASYKGTKIDPELPGYYKGEFALVARGKNYTATRTLIMQAMAALTINAETQVGPMLVKYSRPRTLPVSYPIPAGGLTEFVTNIDCAYVLPL
ncbi:minor capsid protein [Paraburkholderia sp. RCC_158]|uniref:phage tail terminator protein n=1 Tax=Paraburkholderia sp. RCC_158 TaxID=3239220 RepID=UPI003524BD4C